MTHNPEFTSCEFYWAYADMYDCMDLTEELVSWLVKEMTGSYETTFTNQHGEVMNVNWAAPWRRVEMIPELERKSWTTQTKWIWRTTILTVLCRCLRRQVPTF